MKMPSKIVATSGAWKIELNGMGGLGSYTLFNFLMDVRSLEESATVTRNGEFVAALSDLANKTNRQIKVFVAAVRRADYAKTFEEE